MTTTPDKLETGGKAAESAAAVNPYHNPSYPQRTHFAEHEQLAAVLRSCEERLGSAFAKLESVGSEARQPALARLYHQMQGARDQVAEMARRIPLETGELYREDKERLAQAVAAFERTWKRWEQR